MSINKRKPVLVSLATVKEQIAKEFGKRSRENIQRDFEYGMGVSKLMGFEDLMDVIAERYMNANKIKTNKSLKANKDTNNKTGEIPELFLTDDFNKKLMDVITKTDKMIDLLTTSSKTVKKKYKK